MTGPCLAMLPTIIDDLQVEFVPSFLGEKSLQVLLGLEYASSVGQFPALGQSMNMGIDGKSGNPEGLAHDHGSGFVTDAGKRLEASLSSAQDALERRKRVVHTTVPRASGA